MAVTRIQNVYYTATDMARTRAFYENALGLGLKFADGTRWTQYGVAGANFTLASKEEAADPAIAGATVVFEVDDISAHAAAIVTAGGTVLGERDMGAHGRTLAFADPEGHVGQLFMRAKPAT